MKRCHKCGAEWVSDKRQPGVKEVCARCNAYLHCCKNCRHRDPAKHNECRIPNTEWVGDRAGCNFCDEFEFKDSDVEAGRDAGNLAKARSALDELFGGDITKQAEGRDAFDKLFRDST